MRRGTPARSAGDRGRASRLPGSVRNPGADLRDELQFHLEGRIDELVAGGMSRAQAEATARARFGDVVRIEAECRLIDQATDRHRAHAEFLGDLRRDLRYAVRGLISRPLVTSIIVITLALSIGANTAIFSVVNAVLLHPLPVPWLNQLVVLQDDFSGLNLHGAPVSVGEALDLLHRTDLFQSATAFDASDLNLTGSGEPRRVAAVSTLGDFFSVLDARPYLGYAYRPTDSENGHDHVVVLSYDFWQELTGGDSRVIGRTLRLDDESYEVIGVLGPEFHYPRTAQIWRPIRVTPRTLEPDQRGSDVLTAIARLRPGTSIHDLPGQLAAEANRWHQRIGRDAYPEAIGHSLSMQPFVAYLAGQLEPILLVLCGAVAFVLLIACANVASLQLVRGARRARELAIRTALGAARWRLVRELLVENAALAVAGGILGLGVGDLVITLIAHSDAGTFAMLRSARLDPMVLAFTGLVTALSAVLFGTVPALRTVRVDAGDVLIEARGRGTSASPRSNRFLQGTVVVQVALALTLLLGSGLLIRSLAKLLNADSGFRPRQVMTMEISVEGPRYSTPASRLALHDALLERLRAIPGVEFAGTAWGLPFTDLGTSSPFRIIGRPPVTGAQEPHANMWRVGGDYFRAMGIQLVAGRTFTGADVDGAQEVSIVDETLAKQFFPNENPLGKEINQGPTSTIIGVVRSVKKDDLGAPDKAAVYYPYSQTAWAIGSMSVAVRTTLPMSAVAPLLRSAVRDLDRTLPIFDIAPMQERVGRSLGARRLAMSVLAGFAGLSLLLAVLGIYGVLSYAVSQRRHEMGIRLALGADAGGVVQLVVRSGVALVAMGLVVGIAGFLVLVRVMTSLVYGISTYDPITITIAVALLAGAGLLACYLPARRAAAVDPVEALRSE
jgi:putative ABC transport system permease protein